jgi:hypothetical protein
LILEEPLSLEKLNLSIRTIDPFRYPKSSLSTPLYNPKDPHLFQCTRILGKPYAKTPITTTPTTSLQRPSPFGFGTIPPLQSPVLPTLTDNLDREIEEYLREAMSSPWPSNGFDFWKREHRKFSMLCVIARAVLTVPATSIAARKLLDGLSPGTTTSREVWKKALLVYNDAFISV